MVEQLCFAYKNYILCNANYCTYWNQAIKKLQDLKNDDGAYKPNALHRIHDSYFDEDASARYPIAAGNFLLHYMCSGKKNLKPCLLKPFTPASRKLCRQLNSLTIVMKKKLMMTKPRSSSYSFPKEDIQNYVYHGNCVFKQETLEDLKNFFQGNYDTNPQKS